MGQARSVRMAAASSAALALTFQIIPCGPKLEPFLVDTRLIMFYFKLTKNPTV
jgi:hypothetical protein